MSKHLDLKNIIRAVNRFSDLDLDVEIEFAEKNTRLKPKQRVILLIMINERAERQWKQAHKQANPKT